MSESPVLYDEVDSVAIVTLNSPGRLNAVSADMAGVLVDRLTDARHRSEVRAVILTGAGRAFCAGADLVPAERRPSRFERKAPVGLFAEVTRAIVAVDKPIVAALTGAVVGAGLAYALATDRRFADSTVRMSAIWMKRGLHPDCGVSYFLPRLVGLPEALRLTATGEMLDAAEAFKIGLVDELVEEGTALKSALAYTKSLANGPSVAMDLARRGIYKSLSATLDDVLDYEGWAVAAVAQTSDRREGIRAFMEKREPQFTGD